MAEILLSLTIIGVVAAITLPSLTGNINERTWNTQRKALYARFSQAIALMPALNGYGTLDETTDTAAETFVTAGLSKVLKINNICDSEHFKDCGLPEKLITYSNDVISPIPNNLQDFYSDFSLPVKAAAFETANGESILVYYNPSCVSSTPNWQRISKEMCANLLYDLNGVKGPNTMGKDMGFMSMLYSVSSVVVAPIPTTSDVIGASYRDASNKCRNFEDARMPNKEELASLMYNKSLLGNFALNVSDHYWSSSFFDKDNAWLLGADGVYRNYSKDYSVGVVRCVKR